MSDNVISSLQAEIARLNSDLVAARAEAKKYRLAKRRATEEATAARGELDKLGSELERYKGAEPDAVHAELERLKGELRTRDYRAVFNDVAAQAKVRPEALGDLWALAGVVPEGDTPDRDKLAALVQESVASRPWLLATEEAKPEPKLTPGPGLARGNTDNAARFVVKQSEIQDPHWCYVNGTKYAQAIKDGNLQILPGA